MIKIIVKWYLSNRLKDLNNEIIILTEELKYREETTIECINATRDRDYILHILKIL